MKKSCILQKQYMIPEIISLQTEWQTQIKQVLDLCFIEEEKFQVCLV